MTRSIRVFAGGLALVCAALAQHAGDLPPALVWDKVLGTCPASLDWPKLHGNVVVVQFPSAFTFPEDIAQWNRLSDKFGGAPVTFIEVAAGSEFLLRQALGRTPYHGCVLFDSRQRNRDNFSLPSSPRTVVISSQGWVAGYARNDIDHETIQAVLEHGKAAELFATPPQPQYLDRGEPDPEPSYDVRISPAPKREFRMLGASSEDRYTSRNQPLKSLIIDLWETMPSRIVFPENLDGGNYDVSAHIPEDNGNLLLRMVREAVEKRFGLEIQEEMQSRHAYIMTAAHASSQLRVASSSETRMSGGSAQSMIGVTQSLREIAASFESSLDVPVINRTSLDGEYDYSAASSLPYPSSVFDMADQLGLKLTEADMPIEVLVVRKVR